MTSPLQSIIASGTKLWLDSIDPELVRKNRDLGATGATSNPIIVADLIKSGRFDDQVLRLIGEGHDNEHIAWAMTDALVRQAQEVFLPVWRQTEGNDGYVSFEVDPLLEDPALAPSHDQRVRRYIELATKWSQGHRNRLIKIPATVAGLASLEAVAAAGLTLNVTLIFTERQYEAARDAIWRGAAQHDDLAHFKSVYSIFVSRVDVYTRQHVPQLSQAAQGMVGIVNAKQIWANNQAFWSDKGLKLDQEIVFASTGTKSPEDPFDKYVAAFVGSDIQTNPPAVNDMVQAGGKTYTSTVDQMPPDDIVREIQREVDSGELERTLMDEGVRKFADPHKALLELIGEKRSTLTATK